MAELVQLEKHAAEFEKRKVRIVVVTLEDSEDAKLTQQDFPHLTVVSDEEQKLTGAIQAIERGGNPTGGDMAVPTTLLLDGRGVVRWTFRPTRFIVRLSPDELLAAIGQYLVKS